MGANNSISKQSSLFKTYNPEQWQLSSSNHTQQQLWLNKRTNQHFQVYFIPKTSTLQDLQKYQLRYLHCFYLVKVFDVLRINDPQSFSFLKNCYKDKKSFYQKPSHDIYENIVLIQHIVSRFSAIKWLTFQEALYSLKCIFKGCSLMHSFFGKFEINQEMIGINQFGKIKVWINQHFDSNSIQMASQLTQKVDYQNPHRKKADNQRKRINVLIKKIFSFVQNKVKASFPERLRSDVMIKQTFGQAAQSIQKYSKENIIYLPEYIAIRNRKNQFFARQKNKNLNTYSKKIQLSQTKTQKNFEKNINNIWDVFIDRKRGNTQSFIQKNDKASHIQPYSLAQKLQSMIQKKADSMNKNSKHVKTYQFNKKAYISYGNQHETVINTSPRFKQIQQKTNYKNFVCKNNKDSSDTRFSLGTQKTQQLQFIAQLRKQNKKANEYNYATEQNRRKTHQQDLFFQIEKKENSMKNYQKLKLRKFPPKNVQPKHNKIIQSPKKHIQKFANQFLSTQQQNCNSFIKIKQLIPKSDQTLDSQKKVHTQCYTTYSNDPSKLSTSLQTHFPINSPKKSQNENFYFKSKKNESENHHLQNLKNQIKQIFIEQDVSSPQSSQKIQKIVRKQTNNFSSNQRFQNYIANRRKSNLIGKGLTKKHSINLMSDSENLINFYRQKRNIENNFSTAQLQHNNIYKNNEQDDSITHTLMQNLQNFDMQQEQQYNSYINFLLENQISEQDSIEYGVQNTVQSSVDEMDDPDDLKNKLIKIKIENLFQQREKRQNQQERKRSVQKERDLQKQKAIKNELKQKTQSFIIQNKNFQLDKYLDPFYHKQKEKILRQTYTIQTQNAKKNLNYDPFSKKKKFEKQYNSQKNKQELKKNQNNFFITQQSRKKIKQSQDTICNYKNIRQKDPYGIDQKYNKYVANRNSVIIKKELQKDWDKRFNTNANFYNNGSNDIKINLQYTQKKTKKYTLPDQPTQNNFLKQTRKKITYEKLKDILQQ